MTYKFPMQSTEMTPEQTSVDNRSNDFGANNPSQPNQLSLRNTLRQNQEFSTSFDLQDLLDANYNNTQCDRD